MNTQFLRPGLLLLLGLLPSPSHALRRDDCPKSELEARKLAESAIRSDARHPESPLALALEEGVSLAEFVRMLASPAATLQLLPAERTPEGGEDAQRYFRFEFRVQELSDHIFWAIVPQDCEQAPYVYGFN